MNKILDGKTIMITGGTGSFGKEMLRRLQKSQCSRIIIFSRDEFKQESMRSDFPDDQRISYVIGDVRELRSLDDAMRGVNYVFHAAALKQVPSCEFYPIEAVKTNILGSSNVITSCVNAGVSRLVCLSTDKAVQPVNSMGMSKAMMEKLVQSTSRHHTQTVISCVRYGNVVYSRGSVIPLFIKQALEDKPLTLTNPKMTRFLMSLESATDLVVESFENAHSGDIFIKKSPACDVETLALAVREILNSKSEFRIIGERHGEKLFEVLASSQELQKSEDRSAYIRVPSDHRDLNYNSRIEDSIPENSLEDYTSHNTRQLAVEEVITVLKSIPEVKRILNL